MTASTRHRMKGSTAIALTALLWAAPARAQDVATTLGELGRLVQPGESIVVTDAKGVTTKGRLARLSASSLEMRVNGDDASPSLRFAEADVNNVVVRRSDPIWNGPLIGFLAGAIPGLLIELAGRTQYEKFSGGAAVGLGGTGLLSGLLIDVLNRDTEIVFLHRSQARASTVRVVPLLSRSSASLKLSVGF